MINEYKGSNYKIIMVLKMINVYSDGNELIELCSENDLQLYILQLQGVMVYYSDVL